MSKRKKDSRGYYSTRVPLGYDETGKQIVKYIRAKTLWELNNKVAELKHQKSTGQVLVDSGMLFREYAEQWFAADKAMTSINTQQMYQNIIKNHLGNLALMKMKDLNHNAIQIQINSKADKPNIQKKLAITINAICESAVQQKLIAVNPCGELNVVEHEAKIKHIVTDSEMKKIVEAELDADERAFIDVLRGTGMRPGEVYALTWSDVDFRQQVIHVNKSLTFDGTKPVVKYPKTKAGTRDLEAPSWVFKSLKALKRSSNGLIVFCDEKGSYRTKAGYRSFYNALMRKCFPGPLKYDRRLDAIDMYNFRHTYATNLVKNIPLLDIKDIQRLMGHSTPKVLLDIYAHVVIDSKNTQKQLDKILAN